MAHSKLAVTAVLAALLAASAGAQRPEFVPVTDEMLQNPDPNDWLMWRRTLNHWGYSPLEQIDRQTVHELGLVWTRPLNPGVQEGTPLVYAVDRDKLFTRVGQEILICPSLNSGKNFPASAWLMGLAPELRSGTANNLYVFALPD